MKKTALLLFLSLCGLMTFAQSLNIDIRQNGKTVKPVNQVYELKKSTFQLDISASDIEGFLVGVTADLGLYEEAVDFSNAELSWFENTGMAEELFNKDQELLLMDYAPSYWYYTDRDDHRFDRDPKGNFGQWTATRTIKRFYDVMEADTIDFKDIIDGDVEVYILMYDPIYDEEYNLIGKKNLFNGILRFKD